MKRMDQVLNLDTEYMLLRDIRVINSGPTAPPSAFTGWFTLLQQNRLLGLILLNLFDLVNYALKGLIFLALLAVLRRTIASWMVIAAAFVFLPISVYAIHFLIWYLLVGGRPWASGSQGN